MGTRIGDYLVLAGVLTDDQVQEVLAAQRNTQRPFGWLCEELFAIDPQEIETAWAQQYAQAHAASVDPRCGEGIPNLRHCHMATRRQAWQFRIRCRFAWDGPGVDAG